MSLQHAQSNDTRRPRSTTTVNLNDLQTESRNEASTKLDVMSTRDLVHLTNREDASVAAAVRLCLDEIALAIDTLAPRVREGGRVIYIGAGTSGRLGVLDASEMAPTYSIPRAQFVGLIAGGDGAIRDAVEGAEDDYDAAARQIEALHLDAARDSVVGIAASGRTPYVLGGLSYAKNLGCTTVGVVCVRPSLVEAAGDADVVIAPVTGPEIVTGSTRMKAGTATKMVLNMISTAIMVKLGKTYGNLMIDLRATNLKLRQRAVNMLRQVCATSCPGSYDDVVTLLDQCQGSVKLAAAALLLRKPVPDARTCLQRHGGLLGSLLEEATIADEDAQSRQEQEQCCNLVVAIDGGGSGCKCVIMDTISRQCWHGHGGPCNILSVGVQAAVQAIAGSLQQTINAHPTLGNIYKSSRPMPISRAWVGIAGYDGEASKALVQDALNRTLRLQRRQLLRVTADVDLLPASVPPEVNYAVAVVAGTGSVAMSFERREAGNANEKEFVRVARVGGWGHVLGDEGSGYWMGRMGLRSVLASFDSVHNDDDDDDDDSSTDVLVGRILDTIAGASTNGNKKGLLDIIRHATSAGPSGVAKLAETVLSSYSSSAVARDIVHKGAESLAALVANLVRKRPSKTCDDDAVLVVSGGLMKHGLYRRLLEDQLLAQRICFSSIRFVADAHIGAVECLAREILGR